MTFITIFKSNEQRRYPSLLVDFDIEIASDEFIIYTDKFGRQWKLEPINSENILMPFIIKPLPKEK